MPCGGPEYSRERADEAYAAVVELLKDKFHIFKHEADALWADDRKWALDGLKAAIHEAFKIDSYEGW